MSGKSWELRFECPTMTKGCCIPGCENRWSTGIAFTFYQIPCWTFSPFWYHVGYCELQLCLFNHWQSTYSPPFSCMPHIAYRHLVVVCESSLKTHAATCDHRHSKLYILECLRCHPTYVYTVSNTTVLPLNMVLDTLAWLLQRGIVNLVTSLNNVYSVCLHSPVSSCIPLHFLYIPVFSCILLYTPVFCILLYTSVYSCILLYSPVYAGPNVVLCVLSHRCTGTKGLLLYSGSAKKCRPKGN